MSEISLKIVYFDSYSFNLETCELKKFGKQIPLRPKAARLLARLIAAEGEIISHEKLYSTIWGGRIVERQVGLHQLIRDIRSALKDSGESPQYLLNVPGIGYKFMRSGVSLAPQLLPARNRKMAFMTGFLSFPVLFVTYCLLVAPTA